jgi:hypothetical protein
MDAYHILIITKIEEKMNSSLKQTNEKQLTKKTTNIYYIWRVNLKSICYEGFFPKGNVPHNEFLENLGPLIVKKSLPIQFVESI